MKILLQNWKGYDRAIIIAPNSIGSLFIEMYKTDLDGYQKGDAFIWAVFVKQGRRQNGVATQLLNKAVSYLIQKGYKNAYLEWDKNSPRWILDWYIKRGFIEFEFGQTCILLKKQLKKE